jgi:Transglycosylase-like domain
MQVRLLLALAAVTLLVPDTAEAHVVKKCTERMELPRLARCQLHNIVHSKGLVEFAEREEIHNREVKWHYKALKWQRREHREIRAKLQPRIKYLSAWLCIHSYEGSWNDPNPPYWGGLQMDQAFMQAYGSELYRTKGTADNWTPYEQMMVAERAHDSGRGFSPWPNTARYCGLL